MTCLQRLWFNVDFIRPFLACVVLSATRECSLRHILGASGEATFQKWAWAGISCLIVVWRGARSSHEPLSTLAPIQSRRPAGSRMRPRFRHIAPTEYGRTFAQD